MRTTAFEPISAFPSIPGDMLAGVHGGVAKIASNTKTSSDDQAAQDDDSFEQLTGAAGSLVGAWFGGPLGATVGNPVGKLAGHLLGGLGSLVGL